MSIATPTAHQRAVIPPAPEFGIHHWLPAVARTMRNNGSTESEVTDYLHSQESTLRRPYAPGEIERAVALVFSTPADARPSAPQRRDRPRVSEIKFDARALARIAANLPEATADWFKRRSPLPVDMGPERFLHVITNASEAVLCFTEYESQGQHLWRNLGGLCLTNGPLSKWRQGLRDGAWFLPQPVTGEWHQLDRLKSKTNPEGRTRRARECITAFRFALLESDQADMAHWLAALAQLPLPIVSIVTSGGSSIHALILVNAESKAAWDERIRGELLAPLARLGADAAALTAVRLTRLPFIHRGPRLQELLFLNPSPACSPIATLTPRDYARIS